MNDIKDRLGQRDTAVDEIKNMARVWGINMYKGWNRKGGRNQYYIRCRVTKEEALEAILTGQVRNNAIAWNSEREDWKGGKQKDFGLLEKVGTVTTIG